MQRYAEGKSREQVQILSLENMISEENPVRVFDAFVNGLDMIKLGFMYAETKETGRKSINPVDMCKLYIYGYFNGVRSSRKLERECTRNIELMWLINDQIPHNKTISDFRKNNKKALENMFKDFSMFCDIMGLIGKEMIAIDGSKFRASNSRRRNFTKNKVKKMIIHYEETAKKYTEILEKSDAEENNNEVNFKLTKQEIQERIETAQKRIEELKLMGEDIEINGEISITDKDARHMSVSNNGTDISHNVQISVDSKNHLVVAVDVTSSPADQGQLYTMANETAKELGIKPIVAKQKSPNMTGNEKHEIYDIANNIMAKNKNTYKLRQMIVEHVFGTVKRSLGYTYFLTRGNEGVRAESFMHFFTYNLKRVINIKGVKALIEALNSFYLYIFLRFSRIIIKIA
jgi:transposase